MLNRVLSMGIDRRWRTAAIRELAPNGGLYLDVASGTGDTALEITRQNADSKVVAADFSHEMLKISVKKTAGMPIMHGQGDALALSFRDKTFDGITCSFGIRNFADLHTGLGEMLRVLKPGGKVSILEFTTPENFLIKRLYLFYFTRALPLIGRAVSGHGEAYSYLPDSVLAFPDRSELKSIFQRAGFESVSVTPLTLGICDLITARRPAG